MKRVRHLTQCDYIVPIGQKTSQVLALSNQCNVLLERTWHEDSKKEFRAKLHAKFNSATMNGLQLFLNLERGESLAQSGFVNSNLFRVADGSWAQSLVSSLVFSEASPGFFVANVLQSDLGLNELSGAETYYVEATLQRKRKRFTAKAWFNHLGCFDSINRLRQEAEFLVGTKGDL